MVFSSVVFLFVFLPITLIAYYLARTSIRNVVLLAASLVFYAWGEPSYVLLMLASIAFNWLIGILMGLKKEQKEEWYILSIGVTVNLLLLFYFKYFVFIANSALYFASVIVESQFAFDDVPLPIGVSFFTFHAISYLVDIYRRQAEPVKNPLLMGLYISLFPQLVAGPIIRFHDVADQLEKRTNTLEKFSSGIERFVYGFAKKVLIANPLGQFADAAFASSGSDLGTTVAWIGIICYTLQIYFDFSGYSDMAIGLGRMFGFEFPENFNYPYISKSIREFWRRWHLSLSTWFRDYLYIPLGGNRVSPWRGRFNLFIVFLLCGLWHGSSWTFVVWGMFHGALLAMERGQFGDILGKIPNAISWLYTITMVSIGWVFFKADNLAHSVSYFQAMAGLSGSNEIDVATAPLWNAKLFTVLVIGGILSTPICTFLARDWRSRRFPSHSREPYPTRLGVMIDNDGRFIWALRTVTVTVLLVISISELSGTTYNPFIYFRF